MWKKTIMATVNDLITIMQKIGIGSGLPRPQYLDYYRKIRENFSKPGPHQIFVFGWKKRGRLRVPTIKLSYLLEDVDEELLKLVIMNNNQFQINFGLPQDRLAKHLKSLIEEYNKCNG